MQQANLTIHCGSYQTTREKMWEVPTPQPTETFHPIPHRFLYDTLLGAVDSLGLPVVHEQHALSSDGQRYFGLLQVNGAQVFGDQSKFVGQYGTIFGVRNSHDQSFAASLAIGAHCFICDNLAFSADVKIARRHTLNIRRDLPGLALRAMGLLTKAHLHHEQRITNYSSATLTNEQVHDLLVRMKDGGVLSGQQVWRALDEWRVPSHEEFAEGHTVNRLYQAATEALKPTPARASSGRTGLWNLPDRTTRLHGVLDPLAGVQPITTADLRGDAEDLVVEGSFV